MWKRIHQTRRLQRPQAAETFGIRAEHFGAELDSVPSRERAEEVLAAKGMAEGLFLVRESSTADGDFVLSVVHEGSVIHYQIRRRGEDALFSLSEEKKASQ